ncbi:MAG: hypothetical protein WBX25_36405 [Rhodomicrobium sp.]
MGRPSSAVKLMWLHDFPLEHGARASAIADGHHDTPVRGFKPHRIRANAYDVFVRKTKEAEAPDSSESAPLVRLMREFADVVKGEPPKGASHRLPSITLLAVQKLRCKYLVQAGPGRKQWWRWAPRTSEAWPTSPNRQISALSAATDKLPH